MNTTTEGKNFLLELIGEIEQADAEMFQPPKKHLPTDKHIGDIEDSFMKKAFALMTFYSRERDQIAAKLRYEPDNKELEIEGHKADAKADLLKEFFWFTIRTKFECWHYKEIGVRAGWELVEGTTSDDTEPGPALLKKLLGL